MRNFSLLLLIVAAACGKSDSSAGASAPAAAPIDVAAVNALVPADLKDKLVFEQRDILEERGKSTATFTMAAPKDWEQDGKMFASVKPKSEANLGFFTKLSVGSNCDGTCEPKDWAKTSEKVEFSQFRNGWTIKKDEPTKTSHLVIAEKEDRVEVRYAWWKDGDRRYYTCGASLEGAVKGAADAFVKACQAVTAKGVN